MSKTNENPLHFWRSSERAQNDLSKARDRFRVKTFYEQHSGLGSLACFSSSLLPVASVVTGALMFHNETAEIESFARWFGLGLGVVLLSSLEVFKGRLLNSGFESLYRGSRLSAALLLLFAFVLVGASVFASLRGAEVAHNNLDSHVDEALTAHKAKRDSILSPLIEAVKHEETLLAEYKNSVSWRGKIDMSNKATQKTVEARETAISTAYGIYSERYKELDQERLELLKSAKNTFKSRHSWVLWVVALVELLILVSNWFLVYYDYQTQLEADLIERNLSDQQITLKHSDFQDFWRGLILPNAHLLAGSNGSHSNVPEPTQIGFKSNVPNLTPKPKEDTSKPPEKPADEPKPEPKTERMNVSKLEDYLAKHSDVVDAINEGLTESKVLERTGVGRTTYYNVKRVYNNLQSGIISHK